MEKSFKLESSMLTGSLWKPVLLFALPLAATGILQQLFNAADIAVVGQFTQERGAIAMAAVGANAPVVALLLNFFVGISLGSNVVIANALGSGNHTIVRSAIGTSVLLALLGGVLMGVVGEMIAAPLFASLNVPEEVMEMAVLYFRIYMLGMPVILLYNFEAAILRGAGDTKTPLMVLTMSGVVNVVLNLVFVIGLGMAVEGVAIATVVSNLMSSILLLVKLSRSQTEIRLDWKRFSLDKGVLVRILRIGVPAGIQSSVFSLANVIVQGATNSLGTIVMAASSASTNIEIFAFNVLASFGQACTTFVGQNYGANQVARCKQILKVCLVESATLTIVAILLIISMGRGLLGIFNGDPEVIETGFLRMMIIFPAYIFSLTYDTISGYLRGFGISLMPAVLTTVAICGSRITWVYFVFPLAPTFATIMAIYPISLGLAALFLGIALWIKKPATTILRKQREQEARLEETGQTEMAVSL
ncbi:MATE family efflux transporter [uncultured Dubosiella sp.]|uniref:MATE family efflux transporter n=2 Tax=uncultured Dubosiella sp. TaxID=1937011 RepID=UPI0025977B5D|nr:MATE family efflux transporter [uncultured Dubosiella sp.]